MAKHKATKIENRLVRLLKEKILLFVVFITGACVLVIEIVATRILAPFFGNTIYSVSSIIGVVLAALSFGYYFGGHYADKFPFAKNFYKIIWLGGLATLFLELLTSLVLPKVAYFLPPIYGPLIASIFLFLLPSFLLGMLSPFAIKLQEVRFPKYGVGKLSGEIFFASTLGSIIGSIATGFYLIPRFGINTIVNAVGITLIIIGFTGWFTSEVKKNNNYKIRSLPFSLFISLLVISTVLSLPKFSSSKILYSKDGIYEKIVVYDTFLKGRPARLLAQDAGLSSGIYLDSKELAFDYTKYYVLYKVFGVDVKKALFIGAGAYTTPTALIRELPHVEADVVEIEPSLYNISKKYFSTVEDKRLVNIVKDGRRYLFDTDKNYDLIFADAYSTIYSIPVHMTTEEFFQLAYSKLNDNGIILANIIGDLGRGNRSLIFSEIKTFKEVFPHSYFFAVEDPGLTSPQNIIFVGYKGSNEVDFGSKNIKANKDEIIANLDSKLIDLKRFNLSNYSILTDNYSPIETLAAQVLKSNYQDRTSGIDSGQVFNLISQMVGYGSRYLGSKAHTKVTEMLAGEMKVLSDEVIAQRWNFKGRGDEYQLVNIIGRINPDAKKRVILATHYDSKKFAILDRENSDKPVPGANDSASGVALLLEIARFIGLNRKNFDLGYDFVFFDGEEGDPNGTTSEWKPLGSNFFSDNIKSLYPDKLPEVAMVADMVCDKNFNIYMEKYSEAIGNPYASKFFDLAAKLYPQNFSKTVNVSIKDDHIPLAKAGIPAFLLIDFDYPYFHTTQDTLDKCSEESLGKLGNSILEFLKTLN
ncbi:hypothetical protein A2962_01250 [Candidatus Woesebacteria bacterium RIFCSPLOWO2_01_FULL_39_61]|uniref:PABS domain-containing protein n=1 Tax=Candidatus Woesebacteria bacterium RIFCSPHIGHO2_02_FULL_39_13 TaxID=1802505 RepID=A0A1F7YYT4_9BACT|nr:MAG: hypothetical protein A3D01_05420 [Candidatus Woesebacteria bacterium RIFCSPHIGHO2_02_FULL_39_13]OGM67876.1 MAG: hypothetical protein A2962_01250 [Candidatus Woesebacteria bacterium RIFCSPLOWO2_01_FULL_39_61]